MIPILTFEKYSVCVCVGTERVGNDIRVVVIMYDILKIKSKYVCVFIHVQGHIYAQVCVCAGQKIASGVIIRNAVHLL